MTGQAGRNERQAYKAGKHASMQACKQAGSTKEEAFCCEAVRQGGRLAG
jgi:hypothetical protein